MDDRSTHPTLRQVMAGFPTGVTVVAASDDAGEPYGLTVSSFTSVSLEPPLVLVCIGHSSSSHDRLVETRTFVVNILASDQAPTALRFASEPSEGRFAEVTWSLGPSGDPILQGAVAWLACTVVEVLSGGDHSILLGRVDASSTSERPALVFHRGRLTSTDE
jgi:flavin reductase (DIM6/NTAB) family NADH-FMN oxidoreductase RutF